MTPYHSLPSAVIEVLPRRTSNALWLVQAEKTIVELAYDALGG
jgi:hypothetical protein